MPSLDEKKFAILPGRSVKKADAVLLGYPALGVTDKATVVISGTIDVKIFETEAAGWLKDKQLSRTPRGGSRRYYYERSKPEQVSIPGVPTADKMYFAAIRFGDSGAIVWRRQGRSSARWRSSRGARTR